MSAFLKIRWLPRWRTPTNKKAGQFPNQPLYYSPLLTLLIMSYLNSPLFSYINIPVTGLGELALECGGSIAVATKYPLPSMSFGGNLG